MELVCFSRYCFFLCFEIFSTSKMFPQNFLCGSFGIGFSACRDARGGKVAYIWIFLDLMKAGTTLGSASVVPPLLIAIKL